MLSALAAFALAAAPCAEPPLVPSPIKDGDEANRVLREQYVKHEYRIPMRDGVKLYTVAYVPREQTRRWPVLLLRTPYGVTTGVDNYPDLKTPRVLARFVLSAAALQDGFIFVHQDVRGRFLSEGSFVDVRPRAPKGGTDEATDAYDTVDFLVKHLPANNGAVGVWGVSYPGFYAAQAAVDAHPAVKAVSPQAPVTDWYLGDDFHHNGALFLFDAFGFFASFGKPRPEPTRKQSWGFDWTEGDAYEFFLRLGPLSQVNAKHFKGDIAFWNDLLAHPNRDAFWKARDPRPRYASKGPAVLTVGGLYDAEDLWGALETYKAFQAQSPGQDVRLVLGPWRHGGWGRTDGDKLGDVSFGWKTSKHYQDTVELPFFRRHLKGCAESRPFEAYVFESGTNLFAFHDAWPPKAARAVPVYFGPEQRLVLTAPKAASAADEWPSDPKKPVPYRSKWALENEGEWMVEDQRFAARRPDVLVYETPPLTEDVTLAGPVDVDLYFSTSGTDADVVVKLIDVSPFDRESPEGAGVRLAGLQQLVRGEVLRGRFRDSFEQPAPFTPGEPARVRFTLPDVSHTWRPGHRLMLQVQSSWFPLVDRNPQRFVDPAKATDEDFVKATHALWRDAAHPSKVVLPVLRGALPAH